MSQETLDFIEHYGKKGMKWGERRAQKPLSGPRSVVKKSRPQVKLSSDYKLTSPYRNRKPRELTNKQLKDVNARINMETNYKRMNPSKVKVGSNMAKGILAGLTTAASVYTLAKSPPGQAAIKTFAKTPVGKASISAGKKFVQSQALRTAAIKSARAARLAARQTGQLNLPGI